MKMKPQEKSEDLKVYLRIAKETRERERLTRAT